METMKLGFLCQELCRVGGKGAWGSFVFNRAGSAGTQLQVPTDILSKCRARRVTTKLWGGQG